MASLVFNRLFVILFLLLFNLCKSRVVFIYFVLPFLTLLSLIDVILLLFLAIFVNSFGLNGFVWKFNIKTILSFNRLSIFVDEDTRDANK